MRKFIVCVVKMIKSRRLRWAGHVAKIGGSRSAFKMLKRKRPLGGPRRRWENNIRKDF